MGLLTPENCDLRLFGIIENILKKYQHKNKIVAHFRYMYRDNGFMAMKVTLTETEIMQLVELANLEHKYLKFTYSIHMRETVFLDTQELKGQKLNQIGILDFETFIKSTEIFMYLHCSSAFPNATFKGFIKLKGEIKNTSDPQKAKQLILQFKKRLIWRGYSEPEIDNIVLETKSINKHDLLINSKTKSNKPRSVFVTKYNQAVKRLGRILCKHWYIIKNR